MPEAGTFVAQDGDAFQGGEREVDGLQDHVPFPTPSAEEMGIKRPASTGRRQADDPALPEAGIFVAQDGDVHKGNTAEADGLQNHVPFPTPSAEEMGIKKPNAPVSGSQSSPSKKLASAFSDDAWDAANPALPEAGTFVAPDGNPDRGNTKEADGLQDHVPFPTPSAEEMGIKKPASPDSWDADNPALPKQGPFVAADGDVHKGKGKEADGLQEHVPFLTPSAEEMGIKKPNETGAGRQADDPPCLKLERS